VTAKKRYAIETFGCQMNVHDSERMAGLLEREGYEPADRAEDADLVVLNTCSVRERAEEKLFSRLGELEVAARARETRPTVAVAGCVAQQEGNRIRGRATTTVDVILGTQSLKQLPALVERAVATGRPVTDLNAYEDVSFPLGLARHGDRVKAYVTIIEGCNDYCAFCVVPYTRGHERMRPVGDVLAEVREAVGSGRKEVHFLGQIVNHYQAPDDPACDFAGLLERASGVEGLERLRFASPHPRHVTERLIEAMRDLPKVCAHIHLPVQSGSTRVLAAMRRRHTREQYLDLVDRLREAIPNLSITTDMIVGFPGEGPAEFEDTLSLVESVRFSGMFSFKYSVRPNTLASKRLPDEVPEPEKTRRIVELQALQKRIQQELHEASVGQVVEVLVDAPSRKRDWELQGRTPGNGVVNFPGPVAWVGRLLPVRITEAWPNSVRGEAVHDSAPDLPPWAVAAPGRGPGA
jgi:tRNA-2-methylthio-N6-dimethylallyladenosine synthase